MSTRGTAAGANLGRTKGNNTGKPSTQNWKKRMGNQAGTEGERPEERKNRGSTGEPL